jgi:hypothetical protein
MVKSTVGAGRVMGGCLRRVRLGALLVTLAAGLASAPSYGQVGSDVHRPLLLAHYMAWYATQDVSGAWGWHWTMGHYDPDHLLADGRREAASHDYPMIGLYDSGDDCALECHALLMKLAGIDGVVIDWYGVRDLYDYPVIHRNAQKLVPWLKRAGLKFAVCYEDQALKQLEAGEDLAQAKLDLQWAETHWFADEAYLTQDGRPVLLVFGPQHLQREQWAELSATLATEPLLFGLPHLVADGGADGSFGWPPVSGGGPIAPEQWRPELQALYTRRQLGESVIATAFPGFHDIYGEAGVHDSYGFIDDRHGGTLAETMDLALGSGAPLVQIATWNDYGEGTVIEPTLGHDCTYLEEVWRRSKPEGSSAADLRLPVALYQLRKRNPADAALQTKLDRASDLLFTGKCGEARGILAEAGAE